MSELPNQKAPKGRKTIAQGNALGPSAPQNPSPEGAAQLPVGWEKLRLDEVASWGSGGTPSRKNPEYFSGSVPWLKTGELTTKYVRSTEEYISEEALRRSAAKLYPEGAVCIAMYGATIGKASILAIESSTNQACAVGIPHEQALESEFLYYYFLSEKRNFIKAGIGGAQPNISQGLIRAWPIPLPPLNEQKRIVAKIEELFSELDAGEESLRRARHQLGIYRQSLLKQAFEGKLTAHWRTQNPDQLESPGQLLARIQAEHQARYEQQLKEWEKAVKKWQQGGEKGKRPSKPSEPSIFDRNMIGDRGRIEAPECWAIELVGNCPTDSLIGLVRSATEQHSGPSGFNYIKMDRIDMLGNVNIGADVFVECTEDEAHRFALRAGDILFNTRNSVELVGKSGIVRRDPDLPTVYNNNLMRIRLPDCISPIFFGLQLCSQPFRERMEKVKKATTSVAAIYAKDFWPLPLVVCSLPEQQEIVRLLDEQFEAISRNEREIDAALKRSEALRQSILKRAFTGRLVPQDLTDEPASTLLARIQSERAPSPKPARKRLSKKIGSS